jgi:translation initiation factor 2B subunit (eIF-2B alpha/beta/delta family)
MSDELAETDVVTVFLRHDADVLLLCRSEAVGSYSGRWSGVAGHVEEGDRTESGHPDGAVRRETREETGMVESDVTLVDRGDRFSVEDRDLGTRWVVRPYLFDAATRAVEPNYETADWEWVPPTEILRRETVPALWTSYDRVRPTVETVAGDREHGSAWLSVRALETLRDEAALAVERGGEHDDESEAANGWTGLTGTARELRDARPSMPVVANRVNRAVTAASDERTPRALERAAVAGIERALAADTDAAARAAARLAPRVATLSRSGTVGEALRRADPERVLVAESRPGREGVGVAERLADGTDADVTLTTDAAFAGRLADAGALLLGADAVFPDGRVLNKVGTRGAATVAAHEEVDCFVVAASDKVLPAAEDGGDSTDERPQVDREERDPGELYGGDAAVRVANPTFDLTPAGVVDAVVTEDGVLEAGDVEELAVRHRERTRWEE